MATLLERTEPISGAELARRSLEANYPTGASAIRDAEVHTSTDALGHQRAFVAHKCVGGFLHHGEMESESAMLAIDNPGVAHACFPGDTCQRMDIAGTPIYQCIANNGALAADWVALGRGDGGAAWGLIGGAIADQSDLAAALGGKAATNHTHAQSDVTGLVAALASKADADDLADVANRALSDSGEGASIIASTPFGVRKLVAGTGIALAMTATAITISATGEGGGGEYVGPPGYSLTAFAGIGSDSISGDSTGIGWGGGSAPYVAENLTAIDAFSGISTGALASWDGGNSWGADAAPYVAENPTSKDDFSGIPTGAITSWSGGTGWTGSATPYIP